MKRYDMFKCEKNNTVIEILVNEEAGNEIPGFVKLEEKIQDASIEKHVPYIEEHAEGYFVKVGKETAHPMTEQHYIQFIEIIIDGDRLYRKYLKPGEEPAACFKVVKGNVVIAKEYCNIHGLWKNQ
ncbi:MAG: desulfoferrodoxin family protein [Fusobacteriaceae bacterium]